jgi:hypothetical protein
MGLEEIWTRELKQKAVSKETALMSIILFLNYSLINRLEVLPVSLLTSTK